MELGVQADISDCHVRASRNWSCLSISHPSTVPV